MMVQRLRDPTSRSARSGMRRTRTPMGSRILDESRRRSFAALACHRDENLTHASDVAN